MDTKAWTARFAGSGHTKYVEELLELFCLFEYELTEAMTGLIWDNSIGSLTGNEGSYVPLDLIQEWMIGEIKGHLSRSDEAFDSPFVREVVAPNVRGAQELKKSVRELLGLAATSGRRPGDGLDDKVVARLLRDIRATEANRFRRGRHYGHVARDDDAAGNDVLEGGKVASFLKRTTADVCTSADVRHEAPAPSAGAPPINVDVLVHGVLGSAVPDEDVWDGLNPPEAVDADE